jgi:hypothetical protein
MVNPLDRGIGSGCYPHYLKQLLPLILLVHIGASVDLDQDATR